MLKYVEYAIVTDEIPNEITLAINISGCPNHCPDCHSKYLWEDTGDYLTKEELNRLIEENEGITCVCFMGGDQDPNYITTMAHLVKYEYPSIKVGWYSGKETCSSKVLVSLDYLKLGPFIKERGPLTDPNTNQRLYTIKEGKLDKDITNMFWK